MAVLENCEPKRVFHYFEEICKIPHGSGNTKQISDYLVQFAKDHDLKYVQDEMNNVVIYKPGTAGYENAPVVIIQGHMDMVCEKRPDVEHDFTKDGLNLSVEGDYVSANGTTLGGDDGIAVAYGLALLESDTIAHPPLEVFITVDEEIGLLGAVGFDCSVLKGRRFINLDSEAEGSLWISCAGGLSGVSHIPVTRLDAEGEKLTVKISGLMGGHSGAEIDKNRANANSLLGKFLHGLDEKTDFELISVQGGQKDNAITREATAEILVLEENADVYELLDLGFGKCKFAIAAPNGYIEDESRPLIVATKYVNVAKNYYEKKERKIDIVKLNGSVELGPLVDLSDVILDIVETGSTLKENNLSVIEDVADISARLIANTASLKLRKAEIEELQKKLEAVTK